jgi:hypothetical protein
MLSSDLMKLGVGLVVYSGIAYAATWALVIWKPAYLVGNISIHWFKALARTSTFGLVIIVLAAVERIISTYAFWRY